MKSNYPSTPELFTSQFLGFGPGGPLPLPSPWITYGGYVNYPGGATIGNPTGGNLGSGIVNAQDLAIQGVSLTIKFGQYLPLSGGTVAGNLGVSGVTTLGVTNINGTATFAGQTFLANDPTQNLQAATKQYVDQRSGVTSFNSRVGAVTLTLADVTGVGGAPIANPTFTGNPKAPTQAIGDNSTNLATTAFVQSKMGSYLPLAGGTCTGWVNLNAGFGVSMVNPYCNINKTASGQSVSINGLTNGSYRWNMELGDGAAESGSSTGSNFLLGSYDNSGNWLANNIFINRTNGTTTFSQPNGTGIYCVMVAPAFGSANLGVLAPSGSGYNAAINICKATSGNNVQIQGMSGGSDAPHSRWSVSLGNNNPESSGNIGSDFHIANCADNGAIIGYPLSIDRRSGYVMINGQGAVSIPSPGPGTFPSAALRINKTGSGSSSLIQGLNNASLRWSMTFGDSAAETGGNVGSNITIQSFADSSGNLLGTPFTITRSNGIVTLAPTVGGVCALSVQGLGIQYSPYSANNVAWGWINSGGAKLFAFIDNINNGYVTLNSDYRIKKDIHPLSSMWELVKALNPISYTHKEFTPPAAQPTFGKETPDPLFVNDDEENWGFIAHEVQETLIPTAASGKKDSPDTIQSLHLPAIVAALTKALQEAMERIEALEARAV